MAGAAAAPAEKEGASAKPLGRSSFTRASSGAGTATPPHAAAAASAGVKLAANGAAFISSGIPDLDRILGGGLLLGSVVMVMEHSDAPHHLLLLRCFMAQGVAHRQPLLFAAPAMEPRGFLGTLPAVSSASSREEAQQQRSPSPHADTSEAEKGLRIAWQYRKYFGDNKPGQHEHKDSKPQEYKNEFDLRKPMERHLINSLDIDCASTLDAHGLADLHKRCSTFLSKFPRKDGNLLGAGRIAIQSLCAPQCGFFDNNWEMVSFIRSLRAMVRHHNAVALITFPSSVLAHSFSKRWQHLADTLLSIKPIPDEDKDLAKLLTGYQDMLGFLHVHKVAQHNTQIPPILDATTFSLKLHKRRLLVLERLNQAPVEASSGTSYGTSNTGCSSSAGSQLDF